jgi:DNA-binding MarR family transcriptional regulator
MMKKNKQKKQIEFEKMNDTLMQIAKVYMQWHNKDQNFGVAPSLCRAEIHTIQAIGNNEGINITELAGFLSVKKPTVSERLNKLNRLKLIRKEKSTANGKVIQLYLTETGWTAYESHEKNHDKLFALFKNHFDTEAPDFLSDFAQHLSKFKRFLDLIQQETEFK